MAKRGRKPKLTPERAARIVELLEQGVFKCVAADAVGIGESTLGAWLARGEREGAGKYFEFFERCKHAESKLEIELNEKMVEEARKDPEFAMRYASRRWAQRFGRHDNLTVNANDEQKRDAGAAKDRLIDKLATLIASAKAGPSAPPAPPAPEPASGGEEPPTIQ